MNVTTKLFEKLCQKTLLYEAWRTVKSKNSAGGIDGMTISDFDEKHTQYMDEIINDLKTGKWSPQPYMGITIPKNKNERRNIGLLSVKDKIIQTAIKMLIEPKFERIFVNQSYGYRPNKGHNKAIRRTIYECQNGQRNWIVKLDIDNYFDTVNHDLLYAQLLPLIRDKEVLRKRELP